MTAPKLKADVMSVANANPPNTNIAPTITLKICSLLHSLAFFKGAINPMPIKITTPAIRNLIPGDKVAIKL